MVFVMNAMPGAYDPLGLQCCALFYDSPTWNHAALECDDGTYISAFPQSTFILGSSPIVWSTKAKDEKQYGTPTKKVCFDCIDSSSFSQWLSNYKASKPEFCGPNNNCSDVVLQSIISSLSQTQNQKPNCGKCIYQSWRTTLNWAEDLLNSGGIVSPGGVLGQIENWKGNDCKRYVCRSQTIYHGTPVAW
jgi:hypothetical protein